MVSASTILTMSSMLFDYQEMKNMIACLAHLQHLVLWRPAMIQHQTVQWSRRSLSRRTLQFNIIHTVQEGLDQIYWRNKSMRIQRQTQIQHSYNTCCMMIMTMNHLWNTISGLPETNLQRRWVSHTLESLEPCLGFAWQLLPQPQGSWPSVHARAPRQVHEDGCGWRGAHERLPKHVKSQGSNRVKTESPEPILESFVTLKYLKCLRERQVKNKLKNLWWYLMMGKLTASTEVPCVELSWLISTGLR